MHIWRQKTFVTKLDRWILSARTVSTYFDNLNWSTSELLKTTSSSFPSRSLTAHHCPLPREDDFAQATDPTEIYFFSSLQG